MNAMGRIAFPAQAPDPAPTLPCDPGMTRLVADADGDPVGVEVWTGETWLRLQHVGWVSSHVPACAAGIGTAHLTLRRILPAALPWTERQRASFAQPGRADQRRGRA